MSRRHAEMEREREYRSFFDSFFPLVREEYDKIVNARPAEELSLSEQAFRNAVNALPCPVSVVRLRVNTETYPEAKDGIYHLITFDFARRDDASMTYHGEIDLDQIEQSAASLEAFAMDSQTIEELRMFRLGGYGSPNDWHWVWIVPYDILESPGDYARDFLASFQITFRSKILKEFGTRTDFAEKYGITPDPVVTLQELAGGGKEPAATGVSQGGDGLSFEHIQQSVSGIQLIPPVPEDIKHIFSAAKKLFVFGVFERSFFNISLHYAFLAMEITLRLVHRKLFGHQDASPGLESVISQLVGKGLIPKGEARYYDARSEFRKALPFHAGSSTLAPLSAALDRIAYQINDLFDRQDSVS